MGNVSINNNDYSLIINDIINNIKIFLIILIPIIYYSLFIDI